MRRSSERRRGKQVRMPAARERQCSPRRRLSIWRIAPSVLACDRYLAESHPGTESKATCGITLKLEYTKQASMGLGRVLNSEFTDN